MQHLVNDLVEQFESGRINRRQLAAGLGTLVATDSKVCGNDCANGPGGIGTWARNTEIVLTHTAVCGNRGRLGGGGIG